MGVHTHTHTFADESDYKKPGVRWPQRVPGLKLVTNYKELGWMGKCSLCIGWKPAVVSERTYIACL